MPITSFIRMLPSGKREDSLLPKELPSLRSPLFTNYFRLHTFQPKQDIKRDQIKSQKATKADKAAKKVSPGSLFLITPAMQPQNSPTKKSLTATTRHLLPKELDHQKSRPPPKTNEKKKILTSLHQSFHVGVYPPYLLLCLYFSSPHLSTLLKNITSNCHMCSVTSSQGTLRSPSIPTYPVRGTSLSYFQALYRLTGFPEKEKKKNCRL